MLSDTLRLDVSSKNHQDAEASGITLDEARYRDAVIAYGAGDFHSCLLALDDLTYQDSNLDAILLRARALIRERHIDDARGWLVQHAARFDDEASADAVASYAMLMGSVRSACGEFPHAEQWFERARDCNPHPGIAAEIEYLHALALYQQDDVVRARTQVDVALRGSVDILRARSRALRGWIAVAEGAYHDAYRDFAAALDIVSECRHRDFDLQSSILYALSISAADLQIGDPRRIDTEFAKCRWSAGKMRDRMQILRHIGLAYLRAGDGDTARERFIAVIDAAPRSPWAIFGFCELGNMGLARGETEGPRSFAMMAAGIANRHHAWNEADGEERFALLLLAQLFARLGDIVHATMYRNLYYERRAMCNSSALAHDTRQEIWESHVEACVIGASGRREEACALLEEVWRRWTSIKFDWDANDALVDQRRLMRSNERFDSINVAPAGNMGDLTVQLAADVTDGLTTKQITVLRLVLGGHKDKDIAAKMIFSESHTKNIVVGLYKHFKLHSRTELIFALQRAHYVGHLQTAL